MRKKLILALLFIFALLCAYPAYCEKTIATATLKVTLRIPPRTIDTAAPEGVYDGYTLAKSSDTIYITAS